jgi:hypothetical protein
MVVYLYKKGRQTMKNIITAIAMFILTITAQAQNRMYVNFGTNLESVLDSNNIFYVGILDRKLLSEDKVGYVHKNKMYLNIFDSIYNNDEFKTNPDTNNIIMKQFELFNDKIWESDGLRVAVNLTTGNSDIVGLKHFETPNSKVYKKVILYEVVVRGPFKQEFTTQAIAEKYDGSWTFVSNY